MLRPVARAGDIPVGGRKLVSIDGVEIALFNVGGTFYAINNRCPHRNGPLIRGYIDGERGIKCPMHGWRFDLATGESERPARAVTYRVQRQGDELFIEVG